MKISTMVAIGMSILLLLGCSFLFVYMHEGVHAQICKSVGGEPTINWFDGGLKATTRCSVQTENQHMLDTVNEIVGYTMLSLLTTFLIWNILEKFQKGIEEIEDETDDEDNDE